MANYENIKQMLIEKMADFLDEDAVIIEQVIQEINDPVVRENSELHIRMAEAAMNEYTKTMTKL